MYYLLLWLVLAFSPALVRAEAGQGRGDAAVVDQVALLVRIR
jgi:hypothetical protein